MTENMIRAGRTIRPELYPAATLEAKNRLLRKLLSEARQYVADAGGDEDPEAQTSSSALLASIDTVLDAQP